jgi:beta-lactamase regulating signal transducer with metallopeptidase domain
LALRVADRARPTTRYGIIMLGGALCALAPILTLVLLQSAVNAGGATQPLVLEPAAVQIFTANAESNPTVVADTAPLPMWQLALLGVWCLGVLLMTGRLVVGWLSVQRLRQQAAPVTQDVIESASRFTTRLGLRRLPRIAVSSHVTEAMVVGLIRPMILLPTAWLTELPPDVLAAVLAHELAHVRRLDPWVNAVQRIVETLLFYHPGVWWLSRRLRIEREFCCDELAVRITGQPLVYARTLELVARRRLDRRIPALATGIGDRKMTLLKRVHHVLGGGREDRPRSLLTPLAAVFVVLVGLAVCRMAWFSPTTLLADDEPRREREVERSRRGDAGEREYRRSDRRRETRRERGEREDDERERGYEEEIEGEFEGDLSPAVRELIRDLRAQIDELRSRLRERDVDIEVRDLDRDGEPDLHIFRDRREDGRRERREVVEERDLDRDGEPDARVIREGRVLRIERIEREDGFRERRDEPARRLLDEVERRGEHAAHRDAHLERRDAHREEHAEGREEHAEGRADREERQEREFQPTPLFDRPRPRLRGQPERPVGLAAEVRELREQVRDLAEMVGDLRNAVRGRDEEGDDRGGWHEIERQLRHLERLQESGEESRDAEGQDEGEREGGAREESDSALERIRERREVETEFRRDRDSGEDSAEGEDEGEESARLETDNPHRFTVRSTGDGNVRVYVREADRDSVLEARVIELSDDGGIRLGDLNSSLGAPDAQDAGHATEAVREGAVESADRPADAQEAAAPLHDDE